MHPRRLIATRHRHRHRLRRILLLSAKGDEERTPRFRRNTEDQTRAAVLGVADEDRASGVGGFHAITAAVGAVAGLAPRDTADLYAVATAVGRVARRAPSRSHCSRFHRSIASTIAACDSSTFSAWPRICSNTAAIVRTSSRLSVIWSATASMRIVSGTPGPLAMSNAPFRPATAPGPRTSWSVMRRRRD